MIKFVTIYIFVRICNALTLFSFLHRSYLTPVLTRKLDNCHNYRAQD